jgi:hypothetical protein
VSDLLEAALRHVRAGRPVFPSDPRTKAPLIPGGFKAASLDPVTVAGWFGVIHPPMLGVVTGATAGVVVLDLDAPIGLESLIDLEREHGRLPHTASVTTPCGGEHRYFRHPGGRVPCSVGVIAPGVDFRGDSGYVIVPPSRRHDGRRYEVEQDAPPAPMPDWLLALALTTGRRIENGSVGECPRIPVGRRHAALVSFAGKLRAMGCAEEVIVAAGLALLREQAETDPKRPIDWNAAERSLRSIAKYPPWPNRGAR